MTGWLFVASNCLVALLVVGLMFLLVAYFSLPVRSFSEGRRVAQRMLRGITGREQPVAFVKEGQLNYPLEGNHNKTPKIILVDQTSVVVLSGRAASKASGKSGRRFRQDRLPQRNSRIRVAGPGMVFVGSNESIRGVTSLRNYFRSADGIVCRTRDGVEFKTSVSITFSLYQPPTILKVGYVANGQEDLRVLKFYPQMNVIKILSDELDDQDKAEVHKAQRVGILPSVPLVTEETSRGFPPYQLDEAAQNRISAAVYYRPRSVTDNGLDDWTDLPLEEAIRILRNMMSKETYKDLIFPDPFTQSPLIEDYKQRFSSVVCNRGLLSYQLIQRVDGSPLAAGQRIDEVNYQIYSVQEFSSSNILRERGITVISAGFTKL